MRTCISDQSDFSSVSDKTLDENVSATLEGIPTLPFEPVICRILTLRFWRTAESVENEAVYTKRRNPDKRHN